MGDALAVALYERRGFTQQDFARFHPGGHLGRKLQQVSDLMHRGADLPVVRESDPLRRVLEEMDRKRLGMTCVVDAQERLSGVVTDGDLRRRLLRSAAPAEGSAVDAMSRDPVDDRPGRAGQRGVAADGDAQDHLASGRRRDGPARRCDPDPRSVAHGAVLTAALGARW